MAATIQTIQKPTKARALDTSTSLQVISQNLVTNGDFATGDLTGWGFVSVGAGETDPSYDANDGVSSSGCCRIDVEDDGYIGITQSISFVAGATYRLTLSAKAGSGTPLFRAQDNSTSSISPLFEQVKQDGRYHLSTSHQTFTTTWVADENSDRISIVRHDKDGDSEDWHFFVDNIEIVRLDSFSNNNHGQIYSGRALEFDGVADNLQIVGAPGGSSEIAGVNSFDEGVAYSWCTWIYLNSYSNQKNWFIGNGVTNPQIRIIDSDGRLSIREDGTNAAYYYISSTGLKLNTWYRLVITADTSNNLKCYLNGVLDNTLSEGDSPWSGSGTFGVGGSNLGTQFQMVCLGSSYLSGGNQYPLDGMLSDFQIWDTTLTADDALYDYNNPEQLALNRGGTSLTNSNLKIWYPMNDGHRGQQSYILDASNTGLGDELCLNGDFSNGQTGWDGKSSGGHEPVSEGMSSDILYNGNQTYKVVTDATSEGVQCTLNGSYVTGVMYKIDAWIYIKSGVGINLNPPDSHFNSGGENLTPNSTTGEWENIVSYLICTSSETNPDDALYFQSRSGSVEFYIGSVSIKPVNDKNHATTVFYGDEQISATGDRTFTGGNNWVNRSSSNAWDTYNESASSGATEGTYFTDNYLHLAVTSDASNNKGAYLDGAHWEDSDTMVVGRTYRLSYSIEITAYTSGTLSVGLANTSNTMDTDSDKTYTATKTAATDYFDFVYAGTTDHAKIMINATTSSAFTVYFDNFSLKEVGTATGWTDADQQLDIPQTALQSYDQLAWFDGVADCVTITDHGDFTFGTGSDDTPFSVSAWVFIGEASATGTGGGIVAKYSSGQAEWSLSLLDGYIRFYTYDQSETAHIGTKTDSRAEVGKWLHVVGTYSGNENSSGFKIYINGEEITSSDYTGGSGYAAMDNQSSDVKIGEHSTDFLLGSVTEVSIFGNREIGQNTVNELYNDGKALDARDCSAKSYLVGYWRNNGLATWTNVHNPGTHDGSPTSLTETMLITAGVDGSRDSQGFIMNRQRATNSLNLYENGGDTSHGPLVEVLDKPENSTGNFDSTGDGLGDFTIEFWLKGSGVASNNMILIQSVYKDGSDNYSGFDINMDASDGEIRCHYYKGSGSDTETWSFSGSNGAVNFYDNEWHHYVMVVKRTGGGPAVHTIIDKICRDKVSGTPLSNVSSIKAFLSSIKIGGRDYNIVQGSMTNRQPFSGQLDDIKIYKKALTAWESDGSSLEEGDTVTSGEVLRNYNAGKRSHR